MGLLYVFEFPLIILGVWEIFKKNKRIGVFIVGWILLVPVGSALTFDDIPNLQRTLIIFPAFSILSAVGFLGLVDYLKRNIKTKYVLKFIYILTGAIIIYSFFYYLQAYYVHQVVNRLSWYRQEGYQKLVVQIDRYSKNYNKVVVTSWEGNPTIFLIFYNKYDPSMIQKIIEKTNTVDYGNLSFGKYNITNEKCPIREELTLNKQTGTSYYILTGRKGVLYVNDGLCKMPQAGVTLIADVKRLDNASVFKLVALK